MKNQMWRFKICLYSILILCGFFLENGKVLGNQIMETEQQDQPYLYKILSMRHWQATANKKMVTLSAVDDLFIHLATEEQLEKIITKYWSDASEFAILKIDRSKIKGRLVHEINSGGENKYYHLYDGLIPFSAIVESKIIYRDTDVIDNVASLDVVKIGDAVLRQKSRPLTAEEILSPQIQNLIASMKVTMQAAPGVGLAAPQIGQPIALAVIEDMEHSHLTTQQLLERNRYKVPFHVIINPHVFIEEDACMIDFFEGCLSVDGLIGIVPRADSVRIECLNEYAEAVTIRAKGWYARILQHEIDHLNGILYIDRALLPTLMTEEKYVELWKNKSVEEIKKSLIINN